MGASRDPEASSGQRRFTHRVDQFALDLIDRPTRRRAGVFRRALRREVSRIHDRRRILAMALLIFTFGFVAAGMLARGDAAGADARAYWAGVRIWINGGDPYHPVGAFLPYVYAPWMLLLFAPWAILPWDVAWFVWRGATILLLLWSIDWAYRRRPLETAIIVAILAFPIGANLDTGNITLLLALAIWAAQFTGPRLAGLLWGLATWMKWVPAPLWLVLAPRARLWGLIWLAASALLSLATLPLTIVQFQTLFGFDRPILRLDYLALLWAAVPWLWRQPQPFAWLRPATWRTFTNSVRVRAATLARLWRSDPETGPSAARRLMFERVRSFLGLGA
jgi:glycosyl transferase family 87